MRIPRWENGDDVDVDVDGDDDDDGDDVDDDDGDDGDGDDRDVDDDDVDVEDGDGDDGDDGNYCIAWERLFLWGKIQFFDSQHFILDKLERFVMLLI